MISLVELLSEDMFHESNALKPYEKLIVGAVVAFMKDTYNFDAKIMVKKVNKVGLLGDVVLNDNSINKNKFTVQVASNQSIKFLLNSLIHELTHVKQISKGELRPSDDYKSLRWKGKHFITVKDYKSIGRVGIEKYKQLPWEAEAYGAAEKLDDSFLKSKYWTNLKGKDPIMDQIMDNI